ncbi:MAG: hypothetical protein ACE365_04560 [Gammaproteobacteria bacterium]
MAAPATHPESPVLASKYFTYLPSVFQDSVKAFVQKINDLYERLTGTQAKINILKRLKKEELQLLLQAFEKEEDYNDNLSRIQSLMVLQEGELREKELLDEMREDQQDILEQSDAACKNMMASTEKMHANINEILERYDNSMRQHSEALLSLDDVVITEKQSEMMLKEMVKRASQSIEGLAKVLLKEGIPEEQVTEAKLEKKASVMDELFLASTVARALSHEDENLKPSEIKNKAYGSVLKVMTRALGDTRELQDQIQQLPQKQEPTLGLLSQNQHALFSFVNKLVPQPSPGKSKNIDEENTPNTRGIGF